MSRDRDLGLARRAEWDRAAFDVLFDRYVDRIFRLAASRCGSVAEAEALAGRMLEDVFATLDRYRGPGSLDSWVLSRCRAVLDAASQPPRRPREPGGISGHRIQPESEPDSRSAWRRRAVGRRR